MTAALIAPASGRDLDRSPAKTPDVPHHQQRPGVKYYRSPDAVVERERGEEERGRCLPPVSGLGTQWIGIKGALDAARKDWMERVRYDHGESFVDMSHAAEVGSRCGRVSIGAFLGRVMYRCEVMARPCRARFEQGEATKTASIAAPQAATPPAAATPATAAPAPTASPPRAKSPLAVLKFLKKKLSLRHHQYRPGPAPPADYRQPSMHLAALFMGQIVVGALGTMEWAPASATAFAHELLRAASEFPIIYRALSIGTSSPD